MRVLCCLGLLAGLCAATSGCLDSEPPREQPPTGSQSDAPLAVQTEAAYVTDPNRWGKLIFPWEEIRVEGGSATDANDLASLIETYHRAWLSRDSDGIEQLLDSEIVRFRDGRLALGIEDVSRRIADESRGERPEGFAGSTELALRNVRLRIDDTTATAIYRLDVHSGARWEFADLYTVLQVFRKTGERWVLLHHVETDSLDDPDAPTLPDDVPSRRAPFLLDFVYPVKNLERAIAFYIPFLGEPEIVTAERASFRILDSLFELEAEPFDERITIIEGAGNGYGVINVPDLTTAQKALAAAGVTRIAAPKPCGPDLCMIAEDPSSNIVVWRQPRPAITTEPARPMLSFAASKVELAPEELKLVLEAWMETDGESILRHLDEDAYWIDDAMADHPLGMATGRTEVGPALEARWAMLDRAPDGLIAEMEVEQVRTLELDKRRITSLVLALRRRGAHPVQENLFLTQIWNEVDGERQIETSFMARRFEPVDRPVDSMDYTAYPMRSLGKAGRFYKTVLGSEPYRDENWFGFWSTTGVFGMFKAAPARATTFRPYPHRNNGYADFAVRSAQEALRLLQDSSAELPHVPGINNRSGIDSNPGYTQILAVDTEGNLVNFSEYLEY